MIIQMIVGGIAPLIGVVVGAGIVLTAIEAGRKHDPNH